MPGMMKSWKSWNAEEARFAENTKISVGWNPAAGILAESRELSKFMVKHGACNYFRVNLY